MLLRLILQRILQLVEIQKQEIMLQMVELLMLLRLVLQRILQLVEIKQQEIMLPIQQMVEQVLPMV